MNKVTIEGTEYNVVPSSDGTCRPKTARCAFINKSINFCQTMPCRDPAVIFLTDANFAKLITARLTE